MLVNSRIYSFKNIPCCDDRVAQLVEHRIPVPKVAGSSLVTVIVLVFEFLVPNQIVLAEVSEVGPQFSVCQTGKQILSENTLHIWKKSTVWPQTKSTFTK